MKDILFIGMHRPNRSPSQRYRIEQFLSHIKNSELQYDYVWVLNERMDNYLYKKNIVGKIYILIASIYKLCFYSFFKIKKYKKVFIQREVFMLGTSFFEKQIAKKKKIIFDFDDAIWMHHVSKENARLAFLKNPNKTKEIISLSSYVIAGNDFLADYAKNFNKNVSIIPTCIDTDEYIYKDKNYDRDVICIGWSGSQSTIKHFKLIENVLLALKNKYSDKIRFKVVGDEYYENKELNIKGIKWTRESEIEELKDIDIGLMPLPNDKWSEGKCGLKGLVYMAMNIPAVMSNVGVNSSIVSNQYDGFLCDTEQEWITTISTLIEDKNLRKKIAINARKKIESNYSIVTYKDQFIDLLKMDF